MTAIEKVGTLFNQAKAPGKAGVRVPNDMTLSQPREMGLRRHRLAGLHDGCQLDSSLILEKPDKLVYDEVLE